jgi:hypothetical protein
MRGGRKGWGVGGWRCRCRVSAHGGRSGASIGFPIADEAFDVLADRDGWRAAVGVGRTRRAEAGSVRADNCDGGSGFAHPLHLPADTDGWRQCAMVG